MVKKVLTLTARRLNVRPPPGIAACGDGDSSQSRNAFNPFAAESILRVAVAPQDAHCQRLEPAAVVPWPFILPPHTGHAIFPMAELNHEARFYVPDLRSQGLLGYTFCPRSKLGADNSGSRNPGIHQAKLCYFGYTFCPISPNSLNALII